MTVIDWLIIGCYSFASIVGALFLVGFILYLNQGRQLKKVSLKRPKGKKKYRRWQQHLERVRKKKKRQLIQWMICFVLLIVSVAGGSYAHYYQSMHLSKDDKTALSQSYFLLDEIEQELVSIQGGANVEKTQVKLKEMLGLLVTYTSRPVSTRLTKEGQQEIRRYYKKASEFGTNLHKQTTTQLEDPDRVKDFLTDIKTLKEHQQALFTLFNLKTEKKIRE